MFGDFSFLFILFTKIPENVLKYLNLDKSGQRGYPTINSRHFLLICNPFWRSGDFLDTIRSVWTHSAIFLLSFHAFHLFSFSLLIFYSIVKRNFFFLCFPCICLHNYRNLWTVVYIKQFTYEEYTYYIPLHTYSVDRQWRLESAPTLF